MSSERALRLCLQLLVLLDLAFVQMTGAAGFEWLLPLFALTLAAPWLRRLNESLLYRTVWNAAVVGVFVLLVQNALRAELASVLEGGLILAALCQVHLLNNLRASQRPDILFLNAFLIAIVTGFLCRGLDFPVGLAIFAPVYMVGLQLRNATAGGHRVADSVTRQLVFDGLRRAGAIGVGSALVFLFWPRDFDRGPYFKDTFQLPRSSDASIALGFSDQLDLERSRAVNRKSLPVLRAELLEGAAHDVPQLWRGATFAHTDGGGWRPWAPGRRPSQWPADEPWQRAQGRVFRDAEPGPGVVRLSVTRLDQGAERLFAPLGAHGITLASAHVQRELFPRRDANVDVTGTEEVDYELALDGARATQGGPVPGRVAFWLQPFVELPTDEPRLTAALELAAELRGELPAEVEQQRLVDAFADHLSRTYRYRYPGEAGAADSLEEFLTTDAGGHCEFFASALATMLRGAGVPCRVVTGYRASRWDPDGRVLSVGTRDAHAWVEVYDPQAGWTAADATPASAGRAQGERPWALLWARARAGWVAVTDFDDKRRAAFFAWARALPARLTRPAPLVVAAFALLCLLARRRRAADAPEVRGYRAALRAARLAPQPGETPREVLARARISTLPPERLAQLEDATQRHEAARYAA